MPIIDTIVQQKPDLMLFLGDNVYGDRRSGKLDKMDAAYNKQRENLQYLLAAVPTEFIWDDHDYGLNDAGKSYQHKEAAKEKFLQHWQIPKSDIRHSRKGLYFEKRIQQQGADIQILFWIRVRFAPV